jgi:hypothetical protein
MLISPIFVPLHCHTEGQSQPALSDIGYEAGSTSFPQAGQGAKIDSLKAKKRYDRQALARN